MISRRKFVALGAAIGAAEVFAQNKDFGFDNSLSKFTLRLAFGSCRDQEKPQDFWKNIVSSRPDAWIWLGDSIYGDHFTYAKRKSAYDKLKRHSDYAKLSASASVFGTWDDHDYAHNGGDSSYRDKKSSKKAFLEFLNEPQESSRWQHPGIFTSHLLSIGSRSVLLIMLDLRYFKQRPDVSGDLLGKAQRDWFESQISDQSFDAVIIGSSVQCLPMFTAKDSWFQYPESRSWLINQIDTLNKPTLILSGDRHFAEFSQAKLPNGRMLTEFTSSGLTHISSMENENSFRIGEVIRKKNFGIVDLKLEDGDITFNLQVKDATSGKTLKSLTAW